MGTICFTTDKEPGAVLADAFCGEAAAIRMWGADDGSATIALRVDLAKASAEWRAFILQTYDLPANAACAVVALVVKHTGLMGRGRRSVSLKVMSEDMGPYAAGGASKQLLSILSPLRPGACEWAEAWRARAWAAAA